MALGTRTLMLSFGSAMAIALTLATPAAAQSTEGATQPAATPTGAETPTAPANTGNDSREGEIVVTGSRIRRDPNNSALPLQIITTQELVREGIANPEQLISYLSTNGNGADNLASNADVVSGAQRGTNGLSAANLRGQGSASTLVLLNGRRVAAHGLQGSAVDVNQIPFAAIERVEVLKDGASAIYGTDAIGGVINFITRKDYVGIGAQGSIDVTEAGGGNLYRLSGIVGYGDLNRQGFNIMGAVSYSSNKILRGSDRGFVNGNQPERGLSIDTRGTPIATIFNTGANAIQFSGGTLTQGIPFVLPNGATNAAANGINILDLPGGAGCDSVDGGMPYDEVLWANANAQYACAWDTGRAAVIQQPLNTLTYYTRGVVRVGGDHEIFAEVTGSDADSAKSFSNAQVSSNTGSQAWAYPLNSLTTTTYNDVFNRLKAAFPGQAAAIDARYGRPIGFRWRCVACGPREYETNTKTIRATVGAEGPLFARWDYRAGASYAKSESSSVLGSGYYYRGTTSTGAYDPLAPQVAGAPAGFRGLAGAINSGLLNPFSVTQTEAGLAALQSISAEGVTLYGGQYEVRQFDASISGPLFELFGNKIRAAFGVDYRRETYSFNGSDAANAGQPVIFLAAFDNVNALTPKKRNVKAVYGEVLVPIGDRFEVTGALRVDDYTGFGTTTNPKISAKYRPIDQLMFRGSYNTGFRVPSFNQIFNGTTLSPNPGNTLVDPTLCPQGTVNGPQPGCAAITPESLTGGNLNLGPETSKQWTVGAVLQPTRRLSFSVDYWNIAVDNTIGSITIPQLLANISAFPERIQRTNGIITGVDLRTGNFGSRRTEGLEFAGRAGFDLFGGEINTGLDGTYLLTKKEKLLPNLPYTDLVGVFSLAGDLGLKWKHNAFINYTVNKWSFSLSQIFRSGYDNQALPGSAARPDYNEEVDDYVIYNLAATFAPTRNLRLTAGIKNLFDKDPPFAITYDSNTGAGSSWEPRVADPRGRSFTVNVDWKFF
ncbi:TonB-dependent receptor [Sphingomonas sp. LHG3406-1]|uniref:TonB-dependent receptor domain-containing protein n=1 Tax=Sphingomonas sp. LHG3406-1 TaxID=2804617 RepID=UPI0026239C1B|nr:TonB-dependent receptor [Sphingomonas sp. LHG3406-1]